MSGGADGDLKKQLQQKETLIQVDIVKITSQISHRNKDVFTLLHFFCY